MIRIENISVMNFDGAFRGLRNPMNSWDKSDSHYCFYTDCDKCANGSVGEGEIVSCNNSLIANEMRNTDYYPLDYVIGPADIDLAQRMIRADGNSVGSNSKFLRQIFVSMDITAPAFWCAELDTYKVGTTRNSCSFMHKGVSKPFERSDFSVEQCDECSLFVVDDVIKKLNALRDKYLETKDPQIFLTIRQILPMGYNYKFTWTANYAVLRNIYFQRRNHRLPEWRAFCDNLKEFPYGKELICYESV